MSTLIINYRVKLLHAYELVSRTSSVLKQYDIEGKSIKASLIKYEVKNLDFLA